MKLHHSRESLNIFCLRVAEADVCTMRVMLGAKHQDRDAVAPGWKLLAWHARQESCLILG